MKNLSLVLGANGHLGNNLVRELLKEGHRVRASVRNLSNRTPFEGLNCEMVKADLMDKSSLKIAMSGNNDMTHPKPKGTLDSIQDPK